MKKKKKMNYILKYWNFFQWAKFFLLLRANLMMTR
jgi:hypothetical protein